MNLKRSLSRHQKFYLRAIARGELVLTFNPEGGVYTDPKGYTYFRPGSSKPRGARLMRYGNHLGNSLVEMYQRRLLIDVDGRLVPSPQAAKQFGSPPPLSTKPRTVVMSRTRPARDQAPPFDRTDDAL